MATSVESWVSQAVKDKYADSDAVQTQVVSALRLYGGLRVKQDVFTTDAGVSALLVALHGTLPVAFLGVVYNIPVAVWLPRSFPRHAPFVFVTPTPSMAIRAGRHVDTAGRIFHPMLANWSALPNPSLLALLAEIQSVFEQDPPVYAKPTTNQTSTVTPIKIPPPVPANPFAKSSPPPIPAKAKLASPPPVPANPFIISNKSPSQQPPPVYVQFPNPVVMNSSIQTAANHSNPHPPPPPPAKVLTSAINTATIPVNISGTLIYSNNKQQQQTAVSSPNQSIQFNTYNKNPQFTNQFQCLPQQQQIQPQQLQQPSTIHPYFQQPDNNRQDSQLINQMPSTSSLPLSQQQEALVREAAVKEKRAAELRAILASRLVAAATDLERNAAKEFERIRVLGGYVEGGESRVSDALQRIRHEEAKIRNNTQIVTSKISEMKVEIEKIHSEPEVQVDDIMTGTSVVGNQLLDLIADEHATDDEIYQLGKALNAERIDIAVFMKV
ncbi:hypothetical protein HK100_005873 [Physocladia obscura]|uniref:UEV domain-containing protein n=1 Tax=Physocladia obscura TaxID=109957 RepID=A0AAD5T649_9FUNG|nr:hypothetical protein HK100_005873 [Physocladia obscura]